MHRNILQYGVATLFLLANFHFVQGQSRGTEEIERAIAENNIDRANTILHSAIDSYYAERKPDSLVNYIYYVGKVNQERSGVESAVKQVASFIEKIKSLAPDAKTLRQANIEAGEFYGVVGLNTLGYNANLQALNNTLLMRGMTGTSLAMVQNNLATYAQRMGDVNLSQWHTRQALKNLLSDKNPDPETLYISYNGMGSAMWYSSKTDSALYYYDKALAALNRTSRTPKNMFYRPAIIENNLSGLYQLQGKTTQAINALASTINNLKSFLASKEPAAKKTTAITFQLEATDNLAGIYKELGDLRKARELLEYSYAQKQQHLTPGAPAIFISRILLGQLYFSQREYDKSLQFLNSGLETILASDGDYLFWRADACNTLALLYDVKHDVKQATHFFEKADSLYEASLEGEYDNIYLDFLRNAALFFAENNQLKTAIAKANKGYNYIEKSHGAHTLSAFYQLLNLSEVYFISGRFKESLSYSNRSLAVVNRNIGSSNNLLDSIRMELKKPKAILQKAKAEYALLENKDAAGLSPLLEEMKAALLILERQKTILSDPADIGLLVADHTALLEFTKQLTLDLYNITKDQTYIDRLISLHESGLYNRIRSRLDKNDSLQFANVSGDIIATENRMKADITMALEGDGSHDDKIRHYLDAIETRHQYQEKLRVEQPDYYNLRYASIFKSVGNIQGGIADNTTLIRYFFVDKKLFALVADHEQKGIYALNEQNISEQISVFSQNGMDAGKASEVLYTLYQQLWAPLEKSIRHKKIVIIPDGILYNINFEILTPTRINAFKELAVKSLLANYTISYRYSLFLLEHGKKAYSPGNTFVAFAPGFSDKIKQAYRSLSKDSMEIDKNYLSLLPQPFSIGLAVKTQELLGGETFIDERSTKNLFKANAGNHKIIHIGTHAESNNDYPEFSRLIFAKNTSSAGEDNSLFVDEIYNCDLNANLTVLTACESGKPGYQDGEGMISLAHAFNYAGSESILTGLWEIDEQVSAILLDLFYKNLADGLPKDDALRQAKLTYLQHAEGRMLAPQYWGGLVIMGDTSPIMIKKNNPARIWIIACVSLIVLSGIYLLFRRNRKSA